MRITPNNITELKPNEIFVFGSNESGIHGAGAAKQARLFGAVLGQGYGLQGRTYAIPTKGPYAQETLSLDKIKTYVDKFINYAVKNPHLIFLVTEIGCGLAGLQQKDVGPLFKDAVNLENVYLPSKFLLYIK